MPRLRRARRRPRRPGRAGGPPNARTHGFRAARRRRSIPGEGEHAAGRAAQAGGRADRRHRSRPVPPRPSAAPRAAPPRLRPSRCRRRRRKPAAAAQAGSAGDLRLAVAVDAASLLGLMTSRSAAGCFGGFLARRAGPRPLRARRTLRPPCSRGCRGLFLLLGASRRTVTSSPRASRSASSALRATLTVIDTSTSGCSITGTLCSPISLDRRIERDLAAVDGEAAVGEQSWRDRGSRPSRRAGRSRRPAAAP